DWPGNGSTGHRRSVLPPGLLWTKTTAARAAGNKDWTSRRDRSRQKGDAVSSTAKNFDEKARGEFAQFGTTRVHRGELLRHPVYTRFLHWSVAIFFVLSLLTGFAIYSPWLFHWIAPLFGGGPRTRALHPWFGLLFEVFFVFQFLNWFAPMAWGEADRRWMRRIRQYATNQDRVEAEDVGFFNGGQKLYFWTIAVSAILFLITGILMWFDNVVPRWVVAISYIVHDLAALVMLA